MLSKLRQKRLEAEKTIWDLSTDAGCISQSQISLIERGKAKAKPNEQEALAKALNCSVEDIFENTDEV